MRSKTLILVVAVASFLPSVAFVLTNRGTSSRHDAPLSASLAPSEDYIPPQQSITYYCTAKDVVNLLSTRYGDEGDWTKTRNYSYRQKNLTFQQLETVLNFLEDHFDHALIRTILQSSPRILRKTLNTLEPTTSFLKQLYGPDMFQQAVSRNPDILLVRGAGYRNGALEQYLQETIGMRQSSLNKLKDSAPFFFQLSLEKIESVTEYLVQLLLLQKGSKGGDHYKIVAKVMSTRPHLFGLSVETNLQPRIEFLRRTCELEDHDVASLIKSSSVVLGLSVEENLKPTLQYLSELLEKDGETTLSKLKKKAKASSSSSSVSLIHRCIMKHPPILALSQANLQQKVDYFNSIGEDVASRIALRFPVVYSLSLTDNIIPTVEFLARIWGSETITQNVDMKNGTTTESSPLSNLLRDYPGVLTLSIEGNLQPTMTFFNKTGYTCLDEDWRLQPDASPIRGRYIAASLFHRLLPRWHYWLTSTSSGAVKPPLHALVGATDEGFCEALQKGHAVQEYLDFKQESAPRLKFSSQFDTWLKTGRAIDV